LIITITKNKVGKRGWEMIHTFVKYISAVEVEVGERRGEVVDAVVELSPKSDVGERGGKSINRLVEIWPKNDQCE
jgi:hypothetical protein